MSRDDVVWCHSIPVLIEDGRFDDHREPRTVVRFVGPIRDAWKDALAARGIAIEFWAPPFGACLTLPKGVTVSELRAFPFVAGAVAYTQELCRRDVAPPDDAQRAATGMAADIVDLVCFGRAVRPRVEEMLRALAIPILSSSSSKIRVRYSGDLAMLRDLEGVKIADVARAPMTLGANATAVASTPPTLPIGLDGRGEIVAVADTGLDVGADGPALHRDFAGRIELIASWPTNPSWSPFVTQPGLDDGAADRNTGHGTHVAGLAVGSGASSAGKYRGAAPGARLVFQALEHFCTIRADQTSHAKSAFYLSGLPLDLRELFQQARDRGARIHVNSWGDPARGAYTDDSYEVDFFLHEHPDAVILFAAGNDGADRDGDGRPDASSLCAPASAKNVIAIGATEGPKAGVGLRRTWGELDPQRQRYRNALDRGEPISGEADRIACFSSAGPSADGRVKPDLCAPGTNIAGPRSRACGGRGWGLASPLPLYMYDGGTSAANGLAGGMAALVRQAWRETNGGRALSGAALKALLILGAQPVRGRGSLARASLHEAGYGRLDVAGSLPRQQDRAITIVDDTGGLRTGDERLYAVQVASGASLRAVLCWYDAPGERLINVTQVEIELDEDGKPFGDAAHTKVVMNTISVLQDYMPVFHTVRRADVVMDLAVGAFHAQQGVQFTTKQSNTSVGGGLSWSKAFSGWFSASHSSSQQSVDIDTQSDASWSSGQLLMDVEFGSRPITKITPAAEIAIGPQILMLQGKITEAKANNVVTSRSVDLDVQVRKASGEVNPGVGLLLEAPGLLGAGSKATDADGKVQFKLTRDLPAGTAGFREFDAVLNLGDLKKRARITL